MKTSRQRKGKRVEAPQIVHEIQGGTGVKKSDKRAGGRHQRAAGGGRCSVTGDPVVLSAVTQVTGEDFSRRGDLFHEPKIVPRVESKVGHYASEKIKLQLFPVDECTKTGLEKDGHNPFLELTLRGRKKISSVLKHIDRKWHSSSVAIGKPVLFPFNIRSEEISTCKKWTLDDDGTSARDVYAAIQSPKVFRLRYGWFHNLEPRSTVGSSVAAASFFESESLKRGPELTHDRKESCKEPSAVMKSISADVPIGCLDNAVKTGNAIFHPSAPWDNNSLSNFSFSRLLDDTSLFTKISNINPESTGCKSNSQQIHLVSSDISISGLFSEASLQGRFINHEKISDDSKLNMQKNTDKGLLPFSGPLDDSLTTLSIGGLLSEVSLLGKNDPRQNQLISDSLDAFIVSRLQSQPQAPKHSSQVLCSSILDAEETCHAFPSRKLSSQGRADAPLKRTATLQEQTNGSSFKSLKASHVPEVKGHGEFSEVPLHGSKTGSSTLLGPNNDESSLGFAGIRWSESLGAFDAGLSAVPELTSGDFSKAIR